MTGSGMAQPGMMRHGEIRDAADLRRHPGFGRLLAVVEAARGQEKWASRAAFDPCDLPGLLPNLWLIEIGEAPRRLKVRLAGTRVEAAYGRSLAGTYLEDLDWGPHSARIFAALGRMADEGIGHFLDVAAYIKPRLVRRVQRLGLPLSANGRRVSHLVLLAYYELAQGSPSKIGPAHFREFWLP
ncbi:PAS domain-containing protein [Dongia mobilis]|uniref:PAS domain-containing protein n=2 Tax=Dongia mobilis TaxID=578943 RepID=A0A4V3DF64_9PROT|nr:PAS domain-containing protein [Dongia mobilis]